MRHEDKVERLRGGIVVDVANGDELRIAQDAGAAAVRIPPAAVVPLTISREEVAEQTRRLREMLKAAEIPVICRVPAGRYAEARLWVTLGAGIVHEERGEGSICAFPSETPVFCATADWPEGVRRIAQGAAGLCLEAGTVRAGVRLLRRLHEERLALPGKTRETLEQEAEALGVPADLLIQMRASDRLPALLMVDAGTTTPGAAALWRQLGADAIYVSGSVFRAKDPVAQIRGLAEVTAHPREHEVLVRVCEELADPVTGLVASGFLQPERYWGAPVAGGVAEPVAPATGEVTTGA